MSGSVEVIPVRVALRIRPMVESELASGSQQCLEVVRGEPQVLIKGTEKSFTYDYVFDCDSEQIAVYNTAVKHMLENMFKGFNVTVLAYGQTGSGKTFTMGTSESRSIVLDDTGVIPRVVMDIFSQMDQSKEYDFCTKVSFIELYKEQVFDLLAQCKNKEETPLDIREDGKGIRIAGLTEVPVCTSSDTMDCLVQGSKNRTTGATAMNARSSRSHAIFTIYLEFRKKNDRDNIVCAKLHLVDLAGSERAKKTKATGERFREGVNINKGLLSLGNVISALCDECSHVPYRDSKLTRLLQDSLGGNAYTLMIACVSPADYNLEETLSTLRYADRARKIKNKPVVNRDPRAEELSRLRHQVQELQVALSGSLSQGQIGSVDVMKELERLRSQNGELAQALRETVSDNTALQERALLAEQAQERLRQLLDDLQQTTGKAMESLNQTMGLSDQTGSNSILHTHLQQLQSRVSDLQAEQIRNIEEIKQLEMTFTVKPEETSEDELKPEDEGEYVLRSAAITTELQELSKALVQKQELANQLLSNANHYEPMQIVCEQTVKDLEQQISSLQKEKDELCQALRTIQTNNPSNKLAEQRRKRLQELEQQMSSLRKKVTEQAKIIKMKEKSDVQIARLNADIQAMKHTKVRLIKQLREDSERFRRWKLQRDRELSRLKEQGAKHERQFHVMERKFEQKQNVMKRKMEEVSAVNKRLKEALKIQQTAARRKQKEATPGNVSSWIGGELEMAVSILDARRTLEELLDLRASLNLELKREKAKLESGVPIEECEALEQHVKDVTLELELRNAQISDLQQKLLESDLDGKTKHITDSLQSMSEAKSTIQFLFDSAMRALSDVGSRETQLKELQDGGAESQREAEHLKTELKRLQRQHEESITQLEQEHQEKVLYLLRQLSQNERRSSKDCENEEVLALRERLQFQEREIEKASTLHDEVKHLQEECRLLKAQLVNNSKTTKKSLMPPVLGFSQVKKSPKHYESEVFSESESEGGVDSSEDPEWQKTPLFKRIRKLHRKGGQRLTSSNDRTSAGADGRCSCSKAHCINKLCSCVRSGSKCGENCRCQSEKCRNKENGQNLEETFIIKPLKRTSDDFKYIDFEESPKKTKS